ncbi:MAG: hypothetical protein A2046_14570 [Bacteroidetes bacterium GWA2_30_7]|nr:MAG: hypothetical protein A2046_14570 [Bacteroidetes bacterium GWA2_30_7]
MENTLQGSSGNNKSRIIFIGIIVLLLITNSITGWLYYQETQAIKILTVRVIDTNDEKEQITSELNALLEQYDELQTTNDTINAKLAGEQERIKTLMEEIKKIKSASSYQIAQYKKELTTLRDVMKSFVTQIDSLNIRNQVLTAENIKVKTEFIKAKDVNSQLTKTNEDLSSKVTIGSVIKVSNLLPTPLNKKGKDVSKANKVDKVQVCFNLLENDLAPSGARNVYLRIARPDELVLADSEENTFDFQGGKIVYSAKREVDYQNKTVNMCMFWKNNEELIVGKYLVDIFIDGAQIGSTTFELK